ncbi:unnamed protein product, partial [Allacma fusca]
NWAGGLRDHLYFLWRDKSCGLDGCVSARHDFFRDDRDSV